MSKLGKRLIASAKEARRIAQGKADPATYRVHIPDQIDVAAIRRRTKLSQNAFAATFGIAPATLKDWEQHRREPEGPARALLLVIDREPEAVRRALRADRATPRRSSASPR
jgi:putative transcriptional regulator